MRPLLLAVLIFVASTAGSAFAADTKALSWIGTGVIVFKVEGNFVIKRVVDGSPAAEAGVKVNDRLIKVDDKLIDGLSVSHVLDLLRGPQGTPVKLVVMRPGTPTALTFNLTREPIHVTTLLPPPSTD